MLCVDATKTEHYHTMVSPMDFASSLVWLWEWLRVYQCLTTWRKEHNRLLQRLTTIRASQGVGKKQKYATTFFYQECFTNIQKSSHVSKWSNVFRTKINTKVNYGIMILTKILHRLTLLTVILYYIHNNSVVSTNSFIDWINKGRAGTLVEAEFRFAGYFSVWCIWTTVSRLNIAVQS